MALRGKQPKSKHPRLKLLMFSEAGVGKTMASIQMPKPYVIDTEDGCAHYGDIIESKGGVVFQTTSMTETITEVRSLMTEKHDFLTLVIDPFTTLYETALEEGEKAVGTDFGRHYGYAGKLCKRLYNLLAMLDMNIVTTSHSKNEYGDNMKVIGQIPDAWKKLPYLMDLVLQLQRRKDGMRLGRVTKTRLAEFEDQAAFEWSYDELAKRYGKKKLERGATIVELATEEDIGLFNSLLAQLQEEEQARFSKKMKIDLDTVEDLTKEQVSKGIDMIERYLKM